MGLRNLVRRARGDRALVIDLGGGAVTSLAGIVAYFLVPFLTGSAATVGDALINGAVEFTGFSVLYHAVVLVVVPFLTTVTAVSLARRRGLSTRSHDLKVVGGIVFVPFATVFLLYFVIAVAIGIAFGASSVEFQLYERIVGAAGITAWALIFGVFFFVFVGTAVLLAELVGAGSGYLLARRLSRH